MNKVYTAIIMVNENPESLSVLGVYHSKEQAEKELRTAVANRKALGSLYEYHHTIVKESKIK